MRLDIEDMSYEVSLRYFDNSIFLLTCKAQYVVSSEENLYEIQLILDCLDDWRIDMS